MARTLWRSQINKYKRVITFGCSWTKYFWPTWANGISDILDLPLVNQGCAGTGNIAILNRMLAWDLEYGFNDTDLVLVNWSAFAREDRIRNGHWITGGSVFNSKFYDDKFIREYWNEENDFVKNAGAIIMANRLFNIAYQSCMPGEYLQSQIKFQKREEENWLNTRHSVFKSRQGWYNTWNSQISHIQDFDQVGEQDKSWEEVANDNHPNILTHTCHAIKIAKHFGFEDTDKLDKVKEAYKQLHDNIFSDLIKIGSKRIGKEKKRTIVAQTVELNLEKIGRSKDFQCHDSDFTWHGLWIETNRMLPNKRV